MTAIHADLLTRPCSLTHSLIHPAVLELLSVAREFNRTLSCSSPAWDPSGSEGRYLSVLQPLTEVTQGQEGFYFATADYTSTICHSMSKLSAPGDPSEKRRGHVIALTILLLPGCDAMVCDTSALPGATAKQQEVTLQGVVQMVMNMETQPRPPMTSRSVPRKKCCSCSKKQNS